MAAPRPDEDAAGGRVGWRTEAEQGQKDGLTRPLCRRTPSLVSEPRPGAPGKEYFILEKDGIPVIGIMAADELEDYLEMRDTMVKASIAASRRDRAKGKTRPAAELIGELKRSRARKTA